MWLWFWIFSPKSLFPLRNLLVGNFREQDFGRIDGLARIELIQIRRHRSIWPRNKFGRRLDRFVNALAPFAE